MGFAVMFGVLNLDKPLHCTSHDVVAKVRKKLNFRKVGHAGTLDPLAQGVLPVCVGHATRLIEYFPSDKCYRAWVTFGQTTMSWDAEGEPLQGRDASHLTATEIEAVMPQFQGKIRQQVPPHAAVHVQGKKLYEYARKGIVVELPVRDAEIHTITLSEVQQAGSAHPVAVLDIHCASGTYIRSIAQAMGEALGTGAFLSGLIRTRHGRFDIRDSVSLEAFMDADEPRIYLINPVDYLDFPKREISEAQAVQVRHGMKLQPEDFTEAILNNRYYILTHQESPVAVAIGEQSGRIKPVKVFMEPIEVPALR
jgi:tRNA pseudouridine55 synthase